MDVLRKPILLAYERGWNLSRQKKACYKPKFATGPALEATGLIVIWEGNYKPDIIISELM